jgi:hypothetical protein
VANHNKQALAVLREFLAINNYQMKGECRRTYNLAQVLTCMMFICKECPEARFQLDGGESIEVMNQEHFALVINWRSEKDHPDHIVFYVILSRGDWYYRHVYYLEDGFSDAAREAIQFAISSKDKSHEELAGWSEYNVDPDGNENTV